MTSSYKGKKVKLEPKDEYDTMEEQQKDGKGKHVADHPMKHVTRASKKLSIKSKIQEILLVFFSCFSLYLQEQFLKRWR
jgi:hypothetical protein